MAAVKTKSKKTKGIIDCFVSVATTLDTVNGETKKFLTNTLGLLQKHYTNYELIIVANGLADDVIEDLAQLLQEYPCIRIIRLSRSYNQEVATFAAIESAIGDYVLVASAHNDPPAAIPKLVEILREKNDIVFGVSKTPLPYPFLAKLGRRWFFWYSGHFLEVDIPLNTTYLMGMNRRAINALTQIKGHHRHIRHISAQVGFKTAQYEYTPRFDTGFAKRGFIKSANLALEIAVSYSRHPLRLLSKVSLVISLLNVAVAIYTVLTYVARNGHVAEGWTTMILEMSVMFFFVFLMLAVIAEYIGQIREEMRDQPPYHIMEELTSNVLIADETRRNITK
jgi:glycosyltransferase involved in cell wall biosynthesis